MRHLGFCLLLGLGFLARSAFASAGPADCNDMEVWDYSMAMCMPFAMAGMPMKMVMLSGNGFLAEDKTGGPRGRDHLAAPNMLMLDAGSSLGDRQYVNLDVMGTLEKWTYPSDGMPELLQVGERRENGDPFVDAQHPHSSPLMGLTLSDTIGLGNDKDHVKVWFAPRGQSTDGPVAFMHRPTGMANPDAPLGHHVGQDVGHLSSTVTGASVRIANTTLETSGFYGHEPEPTAVDLPMGPINSWAVRLIQQMGPQFYFMVSTADVHKPEGDDGPDSVRRTSASFYNDFVLSDDWSLSNALIWGSINDLDGASTLTSYLDEFWAHHGPHSVWGRLEVLQRTAAELGIGDSDPNGGRWVTALTLGYTHQCGQWDHLRTGLGASVTEDFLPGAFADAYGGANPWTAKIFLQVQGMKMWDF